MRERERSDPYNSECLQMPVSHQVGGSSLNLLVIARTRPSLVWNHTDRGLVPSKN